MVVLDLFSAGVMQLWDALTNGCWHARELTYTMSGTFHRLEWLRVGADTVFLVVGIVPLVFATLRIVRTRQSPSEPQHARLT